MGLVRKRTHTHTHTNTHTIHKPLPQNLVVYKLELVLGEASVATCRLLCLQESLYVPRGLRCFSGATEENFSAFLLLLLLCNLVGVLFAVTDMGQNSISGSFKREVLSGGSVCDGEVLTDQHGRLRLGIRIVVCSFFCFCPLYWWPFWRKKERKKRWCHGAISASERDLLTAKEIW